MFLGKDVLNAINKSGFKMTFEAWLLEQGFKHPEFDLMVKHSEYALMKAAWNAAILSGMELLYLCTLKMKRLEMKQYTLQKESNAS